MRVDAHKPCPVCGKPFEVSSARGNATPLELHIKSKHGNNYGAGFQYRKTLQSVSEPLQSTGETKE